MATGGRTARGVLALKGAVAGFRAGGIANAGWVLSVAVARLAARRLGEEALAGAPISLRRRTTRGGTDATDGASTKSRAFASAAIRQWTFRISMVTGKPAIGTVLAGATRRLTPVRNLPARRTSGKARRPGTCAQARRRIRPCRTGISIITDRSCRLASARASLWPERHSRQGTGPPFESSLTMPPVIR
jgi:hypothetical protein